MAGRGVGSWASGRWIAETKIVRTKIGRTGESGRLTALRVYAVIEFLIGVSGIVVPYELQLGHRLL
jgi:hypothetical protein